jgi:CheY-like chemotaxis protein
LADMRMIPPGGVELTRACSAYGSSFEKPGQKAFPKRPHMVETEKKDTAARGDQGPAGEAVIRLLPVDDEEAYVDVLSNRLRKRGFDVTKSYSGTEALRKMRMNTFDVAVLDLKMPDMDGIEVLKIFKSMAPEMEVIMLTGHGSATACKQGMELGAFDYLMKPCRLDDLVEKIRGAFRKTGK